MDQIGLYKNGLDKHIIEKLGLDKQGFDKHNLNKHGFKNPVLTNMVMTWSSLYFETSYSCFTQTYDNQHAHSLRLILNLV